MYTLLKLFTCFLFISLMACNQSVGKDDSKVLAKVNAEVITENQLAVNMEALFGKNNALVRLQEAERKKIIESMVMSRLIRQLAEKSLDDNQRNTYQLKANAYKEKLIINDFLKENITVAAVSDEEVAAYYKKHPDKYGAINLVKYELLTTSEKLNEIVRDKLLSLYSTNIKQSDIRQLQKDITSHGVKMLYQKGVLREGILDKTIEDIVHQLNQGEVSSLIMKNGRPYIVKVVEKTQMPAKPLSEVTNEIRRQLVPIALKNAIRIKTEKLKEKAKIEYL